MPAVDIAKYLADASSAVEADPRTLIERDIGRPMCPMAM
jgi:hypothetical protein